MKTAPLVLCSILVLVTGCSSVRQVGVSESEGWIQEAQRDLLNKEAAVITWEGQAHEGKIIRLHRDSLSLLQEEKHSTLTIQTSHVSTVRPSRNVFPPIGGFVAGLVLGGLIGAEVGKEAPVERSNHDFLGMGEGMQRFGNAMGGAMIGAAVGGVTLSVILGLATSVTDYQFTYGATRKGQGTPDPKPAESKPGKQ